ncbi:hypothetical protein GmHk_14G042198 [Glycine max]|nr:hypothetical protein GmHk_14G042198 [Glycine max]
MALSCVIRSSDVVRMVCIFREAEDIHSRESSNTYINSLGSYFIDSNLLVDLSNTSIGSLDSNYSSDASMRISLNLGSGSVLHPMLNVHALSGLDDKEIYHTFVKVISQCHMLAYLEAINHIFVFPEELVLPFFKSWATCVYYKDMGKRWYILVEYVPVILSYQTEFPYQNVFYHSQISIKWPFTRIGLETLQYQESISRIPPYI